MIETNLPGATLGSAPEYLSQWFINNPRSKPTINILRKIQDKTTWGRILGRALEDGISSNLVTRFMYDYSLETFRERLDSEWTFYNVRIGNPGDTITPVSLLREIEEGQN